MVPNPDELPEPVVGWLDAVPGERGVERIDTAFEFLNPVPDRDVRAVNADPAENALGFVKIHAAVVEDDCYLHDERVGTVALEEFNVLGASASAGRFGFITRPHGRYLPIRFAKLTLPEQTTEWMITRPERAIESESFQTWNESMVRRIENHDPTNYLDEECSVCFTDHRISDPWPNRPVTETEVKEFAEAFEDLFVFFKLGLATLRYAR